MTSPNWYPETHPALADVRDRIVAAVNADATFPAVAEAIPQPAPTNPEAPELWLRFEGLPYLVQVSRLWDGAHGSLTTEPEPAARPRARYAGPRP